MAIAYDNSSSSENGSIHGVSFTVAAGSNMALLAYQETDAGGASMTLTYGGQSMTKTSRTEGSDRGHVFTLLSPPTGSNSFSISNLGIGTAASYLIISHSGVGSIESTVLNSASTGTPASLSFTTSAANAWTVMTGHALGGGNNSGGTNYTSRTSNFAVFVGDNGPIVSPGAVTMERTVSASSGGWITSGVSYAPAVASGPANMKTWNGLVKASVKTINGLALASVKTWNGLT